MLCGGTLVIFSPVPLSAGEYTLGVVGLNNDRVVQVN